jgi:protein-disulfide isomerase
MKQKFDDALTVVLTAAAVAVAGSVIWGQFFAPRNQTASTPAGGVEYVNQWPALLESGIELGDSEAPIKIVEFTDLQCPFCRRFHQTTMREVAAEFGDSVSVVFVHLPLTTIHPYALSAARAAECAHEQGRFSAFVDGLFEAQDSLGLKLWEVYAQGAGVPDSERFLRCINSGRDFLRIEAGQTLAAELGVLGTPTIVVNGWLLKGTPTADVLSQMVRDIAEGREPYSTHS